MSYCKEEGKDRIIFVTKEDHDKPSSIQLPEEEEPVGLMKDNGELNWNCPCLGGMATGPCGVEFREAFTCFHYSEADPKGSDCLEPFRIMSSCMAQYPGVYGSGEDNVMTAADEEDFSNNKNSSSSSSVSKSDENDSSETAVANESNSKTVSMS